MEDNKVFDHSEPRPCCASPDNWKERLVEERKELLDRTIKLKNYMEKDYVRLNAIEWDMLHEQYRTMKAYLQVLTSRCVYYKLIEAGDLGISYADPSNHRY